MPEYLLTHRHTCVSVSKFLTNTVYFIHFRKCIFFSLTQLQHKKGNRHKKKIMFFTDEYQAVLPVIDVM